MDLVWNKMVWLQWKPLMKHCIMFSFWVDITLEFDWLTYNWTQINFESRNTGKMMDSMFQVSLFYILIILRFRIYCVVNMGPWKWACWSLFGFLDQRAFSTASVDQQSWQDNPQKLSPEFEWKLRFSQISVAWTEISALLGRGIKMTSEQHKGRLLVVVSLSFISDTFRL